MLSSLPSMLLYFQIRQWKTSYWNIQMLLVFKIDFSRPFFLHCWFVKNSGKYSKKCFFFFLTLFFNLLIWDTIFRPLQTIHPIAALPFVDFRFDWALPEKTSSLIIFKKSSLIRLTYVFRMYFELRNIHWKKYV